MESGNASGKHAAGVASNGRIYLYGQDTPTTAEVIATSGTRVAATINGYGEGQAMLFAFDLSEAQSAGPTVSGLLAEIIGRSPGQAPTDQALACVPVRVSVSNLGVSVGVSITETLTGGQIIAAPAAAVVSDTEAAWTCDLASGTRADANYLVRLPDSHQEVVATSHVDYTLATQSLCWGSYPLSLSAAKDRDDLIDEAITEVDAVSVTSRCDRHRKDEVADTLEDLKRRPPSRWGAIDKTIKRLIRALRVLCAMETNTHQAHLAIGRVLTYWQARWSK